MRDLIIALWLLPIKIYQKVLSPLLGPKCRYQPTCSHYMVGAVKEWGILRGTWLGLRRIGSCHPWGGMGEDPVPKNPNRADH